MPFPFLSSVVCVHTPANKKTGKDWEHSYHVSGHEVDVVGEEPIFTYEHTKLESELSSFDRVNVWSPKLR